MKAISSTLRLAAVAAFAAACGLAHAQGVSQEQTQLLAKMAESQANAKLSAPSEAAALQQQQLAQAAMQNANEAEQSALLRQGVALQAQQLAQMGQLVAQGQAQRNVSTTVLPGHFGTTTVTTDSPAFARLAETTKSSRIMRTHEPADGRAIAVNVYRIHDGRATLASQSTLMAMADEVQFSQSGTQSGYLAKTSVEGQGAGARGVLETGTASESTLLGVSWGPGTPNLNDGAKGRVAISISSMNGSSRESFAQFPLDGQAHLVGYWAQSNDGQNGGDGLMVVGGAPESLKGFDANAMAKQAAAN
jgi:hypothetical protein